MPAWIIAAIAMLRTLAVGTPGRAALTGVGAGALLPDSIGFPSFGFGGGDDRPKRRRRKRALTASDRADIAFITATLGKAAGGNFAAIIAANR